MPIPPTANWALDDHRITAMKNFKAALNDPTERKRCILDPCYAKQKFSDVGGFYLEGEGDYRPIEWIPATTVFRVYESKQDRLKRDEQVVLVLDGPAGLEPYKVDVIQTWRCTYTPYDTKAIAAKSWKPPVDSSSE